MKRVAILMGLVGVWLGLSGATAPTGHAQAMDCYITLSPDQSIQSAIDDARRGDVICLKAGTWEENLEITHSLTLRGIGDARSTIEAPKDTIPVIGVNASSQEIKVIRLQHLELTGSQPDSIGELAGGVSVLNPSVKGSASLILHDLRITDNITGVSIGGPNVSMRITRSDIEGNRNGGVRVIGASELRISDSRVARNGTVGIGLRSGASALVQGTVVRDQTGAVGLGSALGIDVGANSHLQLVNSQVVNNGHADKMALMNAGIRAGFGVKFPGGVPSLNLPAHVDIVNSEINANRHGLLLGGQASLRLENAAVQGNQSWGLAGMMGPCLETGVEPAEAETLKGSFGFSGRNVIKGNNAAGNLDGEGNPGQHPFHHLADGQVCLPR